MLTDTEGIVLRQVKTSYGRRMILLFSKKYGKISAGTGLNERGKGKSSLALRPFTYGRYELFKNRDSYNINGAEVLKSYYGIGEDVDKYMNGAYVLEFTERVLCGGSPVSRYIQPADRFLRSAGKQRQRYRHSGISVPDQGVQIHGSDATAGTLCNLRRGEAGVQIQRRGGGSYLPGLFSGHGKFRTPCVDL